MRRKQRAAPDTAQRGADFDPVACSGPGSRRRTLRQRGRGGLIVPRRAGPQLPSSAKAPQFLEQIQHDAACGNAAAHYAQGAEGARADTAHLDGRQAAAQLATQVYEVFFFLQPSQFLVEKHATSFLSSSTVALKGMGAVRTARRRSARASRPTSMPMAAQARWA